MTLYIIDFVVIPDIIWLKAFSCNKWVAKNKWSLNVWRGTFHPIVIKTSHRGQAIYNGEVPYNEWLEYEWLTLDHLITWIYT
jgi:hypothetical protein